MSRSSSYESFYASDDKFFAWFFVIVFSIIIGFISLVFYSINSSNDEVRDYHKKLLKSGSMVKVINVENFHERVKVGKPHLNNYMNVYQRVVTLETKDGQRLMVNQSYDENTVPMIGETWELRSVEQGKISPPRLTFIRQTGKMKE